MHVLSPPRSSVKKSPFSIILSIREKSRAADQRLCRAPIASPNYESRPPEGSPDNSPLRIPHLARQEQENVEDPPQPHAAKSAELQYTQKAVAQIEAIRSEVSEEH